MLRSGWMQKIATISGSSSHTLSYIYMHNNLFILIATMTSSSFSVTKTDGELVTPSEPTPPDTLRLSSIDRVFIVGLFVETIHVFKHGVEPAKIIKQALSKALGPYYPLSGRLVRSEAGEVQVACTGEGVWFVEATANCSLEDVNGLQEQPILLPKTDLLPSHPEQAGMMVMMQVTEFTCGGFVVSILFDHTITDGLGISQFVAAIGDISRGLSKPKIKPVWERESIPALPKQLGGALSPLPTYHLETFTMDITPDCINKLKSQYFDQTNKICSSFDVLTALVWKCRTHAINFEPDVEVTLNFMANVRSLLQHVLPSEGGYYGNCIYPVVITVPSGKVINSSIIEVIAIIKNAKDRLQDEFASWANGELKEDPFKIDIKYENIFLTDWTRVGFNEVDYGWGRPDYITSLMSKSGDFVSMCSLLKSPAPKAGIRVIAQCVKEEDLAAFQRQMEKYVA